MIEGETVKSAMSEKNAEGGELLYCVVVIRDESGMGYSIKNIQQQGRNRFEIAEDLEAIARLLRLSEVT